MSKQAKQKQRRRRSFGDDLPPNGATNDTAKSPLQSQSFDVPNEREELIARIHDYNKRHQLDLFRLDLSDDADGYSGALRFSYTDEGAGSGRMITKAVRLDSETTTFDLLPRLKQKFRPGSALSTGGADDEQLELSVTSEGGEHVLRMDDHPLEVALKSPTMRGSPHFFLRRRSTTTSDESISSIGSATTASDRLGSSSPVAAAAAAAMSRSERKSKATSMLVSGSTPTVTSSPKRKSFLRVGNRGNGGGAGGGVWTTRAKSMYDPRTAESYASGHVTPPTNQHGIIQVFGVGISPESHSQYKGILATKTSTTLDVIQSALERYHVSGRNPSEYLLCDVIGTWRGDASKSTTSKTWITEHSRVLSADEFPLVLQLLWKPDVTYQRRFELRQRPPFGRHSPYDVQQREAKEQEEVVAIRSATVSKSDDDDDDDDDNNDEGRRSGCYRIPSSLPFLINLRGCNSPSEFVLYRLVDDSTVVGREGGGAVDESRLDIVLPGGDDLMPVHCVFHQRRRRDDARDGDGESPTTWIEPMPDADVALNGAKIDRPNQILPGDLIAIGSRYLFLFKDPNQAAEIMGELHWEQAPLSQLERRAEDFVVKSSSSSPSNPFRRRTRSNNVATAQEEQPPRPRKLDRRMSFPYAAQDEDVLLEHVLLGGDATTALACRLAPAYVLAMMVEYASVKRGEKAAVELTTKIGEILQEVLWEKTRSLSEKNASIDSPVNDLLPQLQPVVFWMSNAVELFHYLNVELPSYLAERRRSKVPSGANPTLTQVLGKDVQDSVAVLEEIIFYSFQQIMYPLTKVLYTVLPSLLEDNPFESGSLTSTAKEIDGVLHFMQAVQELMNACSLHQTIVSQVFSNLFFFVNASLVNTLMDHDTGTKFYCWAKGIQIRCNLDLFDAWANKNGLRRELLQYASKLFCIADLLAIPKETLLQMKWSAVRAEFPSLHAVQVHRILAAYHLNSGEEVRPRRWNPTEEDRVDAENQHFLLEGYDSHPPLYLPAANFQLDLQYEPIGDGFDAFVDETTALLHREENESPLDESTVDPADVSVVDDSVVIAAGLGVKTPEKVQIERDEESSSNSGNEFASDVPRASRVEEVVVRSAREFSTEDSGREEETTEDVKEIDLVFEQERMTSPSFQRTPLASVVEEEEEEEEEEEGEMAMQFVFTQSVVERNGSDEVSNGNSDDDVEVVLHDDKGESGGSDDDDDDDRVPASVLRGQRESGDGSESEEPDESFDVRKGDGRMEEESATMTAKTKADVVSTIIANGSRDSTPAHDDDDDDDSESNEESSGSEEEEEDEEEKSEDEETEEEATSRSDLTDERDSDVDALMAKAAMLLGDDSDGELGSPLASPPSSSDYDLDMAVLKKRLKEKKTVSKEKRKRQKKKNSPLAFSDEEKRLSIVEEEGETKNDREQNRLDENNRTSRIADNDNIYVVKLKKSSDDQLGLILSDFAPAALSQPEIRVSGLKPGFQCGKIAIGDQLLAVEGRSLSEANRKLAMKYIKEAPNEVTLLLSRKIRVLHSLATSEC